jgi:hypothetical protein
LTGNTLNNSNNVASVQGLLFIVDFLLFNKEETLALNFHIIVLLLSGALTETATTTNSALGSVPIVVIARVLITLVSRSGSSIGNVLAFLLLFFLALLAPDFVNIQKLDSDEITFESTVSVLATTNEDISIKQTILSGNISITTVLLVDTEDTGHELPISQKSGEGGLRKIGGKKGLSLLLLLLTTKLTSMLGALETHKRLAIHLSGLQSL